MYKLYFDILDVHKNFITGFSKEEEIVKRDVLVGYIGNYQYSISIEISLLILMTLLKKIDFKINSRDGTVSLPLDNKRILKETCSKFTKLGNYLLKNNNKRIMISSQFTKQGHIYKCISKC